MTDEQIEQLAQRVARIILDQLHEGLLLDVQPDDEEDLLAELARCMTLMSKYLAEEQYEKCELLKKKIKTIEQKLKNLCLHISLMTVELTGQNLCIYNQN